MNDTINAKDFGRVAVLMGGFSAERSVSLKSGAAVLSAALAAGVDAFAVDLTRDSVGSLMTLEADRVFIALHGKYGEDGTVQGLLDLRDLPYTGTGVLASALGMDKVKTKQLWKALDLPTPAYMFCKSCPDLEEVSSQIGFPLIVKPANEGSSIGIRKVVDGSQLADAVAEACQYDTNVLLEAYIQGREFTAAIVNDQVFPLIELESANEIYDFAAKYELDSTKYHCPPDITSVQSEDWSALCRRAFFGVGGEGWGRVDFMVDETGKAWLLEVNTSPGMTDHSLVPMAAKAVGLEFLDLVLQILATTLKTKRGS